MVNSKVIFKSPQNCTWIEKFEVNKNPKQLDFFSFCDAIFIITVKKNFWTSYQIDMIKNIYRLGCQDRTYWCFTKGSKKCTSNDGEIYGSLGFNWKVICEFCIQENMQNILIMEDDLLITNKLWDNYFEKKKKIIKVINNNKDKNLIFHFGQLPILSIPVNKYISTGLNLNAHCILINKLAAKKYLNIYSQQLQKFKKNIEKKKIRMMVISDQFYWNNMFERYSLIPNNIFFQKSNPSSSTNKIEDKWIWQTKWQNIQAFFTGRQYYQYDPKFVIFWEPITGFTFLTLLILIILIVIVVCFTFYLYRRKYRF